MAAVVVVGAAAAVLVTRGADATKHRCLRMDPRGDSAFVEDDGPVKWRWYSSAHGLSAIPSTTTTHLYCRCLV